MKSEKCDVISLLGTLPPLRGLSSYCREFALALADTRPVAFISFNKLYPASLYPGGGLKEDVSFPVTEHGNLTVRRCLCWYNPMTWLFEGLLTPGILLHAQWWSLPLAPIYAILCLCFKLRKKTVVFTVHNVFPHEASRLFKMVSAALFHFGDHFIVHTRQNQQQMMDQYGIRAENISIIDHGTLGFQSSTSSNALNPWKRTIRIFILSWVRSSPDGMLTTLQKSPALSPRWGLAAIATKSRSSGRRCSTRRIPSRRRQLITKGRWSSLSGKSAATWGGVPGFSGSPRRFAWSIINWLLTYSTASCDDERAWTSTYRGNVQPRCQGCGFTLFDRFCSGRLQRYAGQSGVGDDARLGQTGDERKGPIRIGNGCLSNRVYGQPV